MKSKISLRDWQILSTYLDRQLDDRQRTRLEILLRDDPVLRSALTDLRRTQLILRSQPKPRRRRNFTLTSEMVGAPIRSSPLIPAMSLASALAGILFLVVFVGDLMMGRLSLPAAQPMEAMVEEFTGEVELDAESLRMLASPAPSATDASESIEQMAAPKAFAYPPPPELSAQVAEPEAESAENLAQSADTQTSADQFQPGETGRRLFGLNYQMVLGIEIFLLIIAVSAALTAIYVREKGR